MTVTPLRDKLASSLKALPDPNKPDEFYRGIISLVITYNALKRESKLIGEPEVFPYQTAMRAMAELLHSLDKIYDFAQQVAIRPPRGFDNAASDKFLALLSKITDEHLTRLTKSRRAPRKDKNYNSMSAHNRKLRDALYCLNPMCLTAEEMTSFLPPALAPVFRVSTKQGISNIRAQFAAASNITHLNPEKTTRIGARMMEPINPNTGAKYFQTYECHLYGHGNTGFYKYHAIAWGRYLFAKILSELGYATCPIYGVPVSNYTSPISWPEAETFFLPDDASHPSKLYNLNYLELAEWDLLGGLSFLGAFEYARTGYPVFGLPLYAVINSGSQTVADFDNFKVAFYSVNAHEKYNSIDPSWVQAKLNGTSKSMLAEKLLYEKAKFMPSLNDELAEFENIRTKSETTQAKFATAKKELNDKYKVRNYRTLGERQAAFETLAGK